MTCGAGATQRREVTAAPKWRRRAGERPQEIATAALAVFADRGYAAARLSDIAEMAGVSKAALYLYYPTKADLFRAVLLERLAPRIGPAGELAEAAEPSVATLQAILARLSAALATPPFAKLARIVIAESGNFPEIARAWREALVAPALATLERVIRRGQAERAIRGGDPRLMAISVVGPLLMGALWREVMEPNGGEPLELAALAEEHARTLAQGLQAAR